MEFTMHKVYELRLASYKNIDFLYATCLMLIGRVKHSFSG
ncbi:hypothetical protein VII_000431 [Vibrio mimicus MB451]|nr:hypothetical protein VII_000431 [Vibrio mimicus MB451]